MYYINGIIYVRDSAQYLALNRCSIFVCFLLVFYISMYYAEPLEIASFVSRNGWIWAIHEAYAITLNVSSNTTISYLLLNSPVREGQTSFWMKLMIEAWARVFARIDKRDLQVCKEGKASWIGRERFT